jgi:hypothetical protein
VRACKLASRRSPRERPLGTTRERSVRPRIAQMRPTALGSNLALVRRTNNLCNRGGPDHHVEEIWSPDAVFDEAPEMPDTECTVASTRLPAACGNWARPPATSDHGVLAPVWRRLRARGVCHEHQGRRH